MKAALPLALFAIAFLALSFNAASAIVPGQSAAAQRYMEYPYDLLVPFFTIACSALLIAMAVHMYRTQWGRKSVITE